MNWVTFWDGMLGVLGWNHLAVLVVGKHFYICSYCGFVVGIPT